MRVTLLGIETAVNPELLNAALPMLVTLLGMVIDVKASHK